MTPRVIHVWYAAIVRFTERAAGKDMCRGKAGSLGDAVEEEDLVTRRDDKDAVTSQYMLAATTPGLTR
jgi:hypothetical protein